MLLWLHSHQFQNAAAVSEIGERLAKFVSHYRTTASSSTESGDDLSSLQHLLCTPKADSSATSGTCLPAHAGLVETVLSTWKLLLRKAPNRVIHETDAAAHRSGGLSVAAVRQVVQVLSRPPSESAAQAGSAVVQNLCFEAGNVGVVAAAGVIPPLLGLLSRPRAGAETAAAAAGALQSVVYRHDGRSAARTTKAASVLCGVLSRWLAPAAATAGGRGAAAAAASAADMDTGEGAAGAESAATDGDAVCRLLEAEGGAVGRLLIRCTGALHNLSCDPLAVVSLREGGALPLFKRLLQLPLGPLSASAAGALQNMSREPRSRQALRSQTSTLRQLAALLVGSAPEAQQAAAAALMNILAPSHRASTLPSAASAAAPASVSAADLSAGGVGARDDAPAGSRDPLRSALASLIGTAVGYGCLIPLLSVADDGSFCSVSRHFTGEEGSILELYDDAGRCTAFAGVLETGFAAGGDCVAASPGTSAGIG